MPKGWNLEYNITRWQRIRNSYAAIETTSQIQTTHNSMYHMGPQPSVPFNYACRSGGWTSSPRFDLENSYLHDLCMLFLLLLKGFERNGDHWITKSKHEWHVLQMATIAPSALEKFLIHRLAVKWPLQTRVKEVETSPEAQEDPGDRKAPIWHIVNRGNRN